jgi:hypothetical protein
MRKDKTGGGETLDLISSQSIDKGQLSAPDILICGMIIFYFQPPTQM